MKLCSMIMIVIYLFLRTNTFPHINQHLQQVALPLLPPAGVPLPLLQVPHPQSLLCIIQHVQRESSQSTQVNFIIPYRLVVYITMKQASYSYLFTLDNNDIAKRSK